MKKIFFVIICIITFVIMLVLIPPSLFASFLAGKDVSGQLINPWLSFLDYIPPTWFTNNDYEFVYGKPKMSKD